MSEMRKSAQAAAEISRINAFFPIMPLLGDHLARTRPFEGKKVAICAHLTTLTGALVHELRLGAASGRSVRRAAQPLTMMWWHCFGTPASLSTPAAIVKTPISRSSIINLTSLRMSEPASSRH